MGLAAPYTGEAALDAVMDRIEPEAGIDNAEESVILGIFAALVEALFAAQTSGNATNRLAELMINAAGDRVAPVCSAVIMDLASKAPIMRNEILQSFAGPTIPDLRDTDVGAHSWENLGALH